MLLIQLVAIQVLTFAALVLVLRTIMYSASRAETKRLQRLNRENSEKATELASKIEEAERQYWEKIESAESQARKVKAQALEEIQELKEEAQHKAKLECERLINQALSAKEKIKEELELQVAQKCVEQSLRLIENVLTFDEHLSLHALYVKKFIEEIEKVYADKLRLNESSGTLISPYPLAATDKEKIVEILSRKSGKSLSLAEQLNTAYLAGICVKIGSLVIDGSLAGKLREAAEMVKAG
jgi:F0F1-type ATP synthase delta subunit